MRCAYIWKATICNHARLLLQAWIVPFTDARYLCDYTTSRTLGELLRVPRLLWTSQRGDLDSAFVSLDGLHSSLHELHIYPAAMRVPGHTQHRGKKMEKWLERPLGYRTHQVLNDFANCGLCEAGQSLLGLRL